MSDNEFIEYVEAIRKDLRKNGWSEVEINKTLAHCDKKIAELKK